MRRCPDDQPRREESAGEAEDAPIISRPLPLLSSAGCWIVRLAGLVPFCVSLSSSHCFRPRHASRWTRKPRQVGAEPSQAERRAERTPGVSQVALRRSSTSRRRVVVVSAYCRSGCALRMRRLLGNALCR